MATPYFWDHVCACVSSKRVLSIASVGPRRDGEAMLHALLVPPLALCASAANHTARQRDSVPLRYCARWKRCMIEVQDRILYVCHIVTLPSSRKSDLGLKSTPHPPRPAQMQIIPGNPMREAWVRKYPWGVKILGARSARRQLYLIDGTRVPGRALLAIRPQVGGWRRGTARTDISHRTTGGKGVPFMGTVRFARDYDPHFL